MQSPLQQTVHPIQWGYSVVQQPHANPTDNSDSNKGGLDISTSGAGTLSAGSTRIPGCSHHQFRTLYMEQGHCDHGTGMRTHSGILQ